jgi:putative redox protein
LNRLRRFGSWNKIKDKEIYMANSKRTVNIKWINSTETVMVGVDSRGTPAVIGMWPEHEPVWRGLKASDLLLMSAASCSTYDVVVILKKQREPLESLEVYCTGEQESELPHRFTHIHLNYQFRGNLKVENVKKAIRLSEEKYCSVLNTLKGSVKISSDFEILD